MHKHLEEQFRNLCDQRLNKLPLLLELVTPLLTKGTEVRKRLVEHKQSTLNHRGPVGEKIALERNISSDIALLEKLTTAKNVTLSPLATQSLQDVQSLTEQIAVLMEKA